jgi:hypothetical protein
MVGALEVGEAGVGEINIVWFEIVKRHINYRSYEYERMMNRNPDRRS